MVNCQIATFCYQKKTWYKGMSCKTRIVVYVCSCLCVCVSVCAIVCQREIRPKNSNWSRMLNVQVLIWDALRILTLFTLYITQWSSSHEIFWVDIDHLGKLSRAVLFTRTKHSCQKSDNKIKADSMYERLQLQAYNKSKGKTFQLIPCSHMCRNWENRWSIEGRRKRHQ